MKKINEVRGYKAFNSDGTNSHGLLFESGKTYRVDGNISFGVSSTAGFHMCKNLEDTLRYFPAMDSDVLIAEVTGKGEIVEYEDTYYGYFDMYAVSEITIEKFLNRKEIIKKLLFDKYIYDDRVCRFASSFRLTKDEIELFKLKYGTSKRIMDYIAYYQEGKKDIFNYNKNKILSRDN